jgi:hypothetical protein
MEAIEEFLESGDKPTKIGEAPAASGLRR